MPKVSKSTLKKSVEVATVLKGRPSRGSKIKTDAQAKQTSPSVVTPKSVIANLRTVFETQRDPAAAKQMKKYMRGQFDFIGISAPKRRELSKEILRSCSGLRLSELHELLQLLWEEPERDFQQFAVDCSDKYVATLCGRDARDTRQSILVVRGLVVSKSWWDTVDMLASKVVGPLVAAHRTTFTPLMDKWVKDKDLWVRRTAILHQLGYKEKTDEEVLFRYCLACAHDSDFFIRKAIGWSLRNYFRFNASSVKTFVESNAEKLSPLSKKEALKHA